MSQNNNPTHIKNIPFNLYDKPDVSIFTKLEKDIVQFIKDGKVTDFSSFIDNFLDIYKLPKNAEISHITEQTKNIKQYAKSYYKTHKLIKSYIAVIQYLEKENYIYLNPILKTPDTLQFLFKEPDKKNIFFYDNSIYNLCYSFLNKKIEPDQEAITKFYKHDCLDEITFWKRRSNKTNFFMAICIIILSIITAIASIYYNHKILNKTQDIIINNQSKIDSLIIISPEIKKELSKIDSSLQSIKSLISNTKNKKQE